jgi:hypothetical protein
LLTHIPYKHVVPAVFRKTEDNETVLGGTAEHLPCQFASRSSCSSQSTDVRLLRSQSAWFYSAVASTSYLIAAASSLETYEQPTCNLTWNLDGQAMFCTYFAVKKYQVGPSSVSESRSGELIVALQGRFLIGFVDTNSEFEP